MKMMMTAGASSSFGNVSIPFVRNNKLELTYAPVEYHEVPLARYSALANYLDELYNSLLTDAYRDHEISKVLIEGFSNICKTKGIKFVVAGINYCPATIEMLESLNGEGAMTVDISVDLSIKENNNMPYDNHPSAIANQQYERKLEAFLCRMKLISGSTCTY
jgi:hypothetical protein